MRTLAHLEAVETVLPLPGAHHSELAYVSGRPVLVPKRSVAPQDLVVLFDVGSFLPAGQPAWSSLVAQRPSRFKGRDGHVVRAAAAGARLCSGVALPLRAFPGLDEGGDLMEQLGIQAYEPPLPAALGAVARGYYPSVVARADVSRLQTLGAELSDLAASGLTWEVTEMLEGEQCTFAWLDGELHVCDSTLDLLPQPDSPFWGVAREIDLAARMEHVLTPGRSLAVHGKLVGPGVSKNRYGLAKQQFLAFNVYDVDTGGYLRPQARHTVVEALGLTHAPVVAHLMLPRRDALDSLRVMADGHSKLGPVEREGLVFKAEDGSAAFRAVSSRYLLGGKR